MATQIWSAIFARIRNFSISISQFSCKKSTHRLLLFETQLFHQIYATANCK